jgi:hypothetical protein
MTIFVNGQEIGATQDTTITTEGGVAFYAHEGTRIRSFESQSLDGGATNPAVTGGAAAPAP